MQHLKSFPKLPGLGLIAEFCLEFCDREELQNSILTPVSASIGSEKSVSEMLSELIFEIAVYSPVDKDVDASNARNCIFKLDQEFLMRSDQKLSLLKDFVYCVRDYDDLAEFPTGYPWVFFAKKAYLEKEKKPCSGFLLLNNTAFFNENRAEGCIDYSAPIVQWINDDPKRRQAFPNVSCHSLADSTLESLELNSSNRILYIHQGNCMHCILLRRIRTASSRDPPSIADYPALTYLRKFRRRKCFICDVYSAKFMTVNDKHAPENPSYFCGNCYDLFHKDELGNMIYSDFTVYKYTHE